MPSIMIDYPDAVWNKQQLSDHLTCRSHRFPSKGFKKSTPFTHQRQVLWSELICSVSDLVRQALMAGRRIAFGVDMGNQHEHRESTNRLDTMAQSVNLSKPTSVDQPTLTVISPRFNHVYGRGRGYFANGFFFSCTYRHELPCFVDRNHIYVYRHLMRTYMEAKHYLQSLPLP